MLDFNSTSAFNSDSILSKTSVQSRVKVCLNNRMVGYQGVSVLSNNQRQSDTRDKLATKIDDFKLVFNRSNLIAGITSVQTD